jgi:hypothetical protein
MSLQAPSCNFTKCVMAPILVDALPLFCWRFVLGRILCRRVPRLGGYFATVVTYQLGRCFATVASPSKLAALHWCILPEDLVNYVCGGGPYHLSFCSIIVLVPSHSSVVLYLHYGISQDHIAILCKPFFWPLSFYIPNTKEAKFLDMFFHPTVPITSSGSVYIHIANRN